MTSDRDAPYDCPDCDQPVPDDRWSEHDCPIVYVPLSERTVYIEGQGRFTYRMFGASK